MLLIFKFFNFSVSHPFLGDYVRLRQNVQWRKMCVESNDQYVVFADIINKIARSSGKVSRFLHINFIVHLIYCIILVCSYPLGDIDEINAGIGSTDVTDQISYPCNGNIQNVLVALFGRRCCGPRESRKYFEINIDFC